MFHKDRSPHEQSAFSHYKISSLRPVKKKESKSEPDTKGLEEDSTNALRTSSLPFTKVKAESSTKSLTRFNSLASPQSSLFSATPLTSRKSGDSNTPLLDSSGYSSSELLSDIILPPYARRSPLRLTHEEDNLEHGLFKISLYIVRCFYDRQQIERFFNSDQFIDPKISNEEKDIFFKIMLAQLTPEQARALKHREYIEKLVQGDIDDIESYLEALIAGKDSLASPFSDKFLLDIKSDYLLRAFCKNYLFFEFVFSENSTSKIDEAIFTIVKNFEPQKIEADKLCDHIIRLLNTRKKLHLLSLSAMCALIDLVVKLLETPEKIEGLLNALLSTHEGHHLLSMMTVHNALNFIDFLKRTEKMGLFFSRIIDTFELATTINASKIKSDIKQENDLFSAPEDIIYFNQHLPTSNFIEEMLCYFSEQEKMRFLKVLWDLDLLVADTLIFKKADFIHHLKEINEEGLVKRLKRWFSVDTLTDSPEIQRAFMRNEELIKNNEKKLQACQSLIISAEQAKIIQNLEHAIALNELKAEWVAYFKTIWSLLLEHWDPRAHLFSATPLRNAFRKVMLERLECSQAEAYNPEFYQLANLPAEMTSEFLQNSALVEEYQTYLDKMAACYEQITACRKRNKKASADPFPKLKGYLSFQTLFTILIPSLSEQQGCTLSNKFIQLFMLISNDPDLSVHWPEKTFNKLPEMLYISTYLSQEFIDILKTAEVFKLSKVAFNTDYHLKKEAAKKAILKICEAINFTHRISLPSGSIEGYGLKRVAHIADTPARLEEKSIINSPPSFFAYSGCENSPPIRKVAIKGLERKTHNASSSHHSSHDSDIPLTPRLKHGADTIPFNLSGFISTEISSDSTLSISPHKR